jgi:hypothetical protein
MARRIRESVDPTDIRGRIAQRLRVLHRQGLEAGSTGVYYLRLAERLEDGEAIEVSPRVLGEIHVELPPDAPGPYKMVRVEVDGTLTVTDYGSHFRHGPLLDDRRDTSEAGNG